MENPSKSNFPTAKNTKPEEILQLHGSGELSQCIYGLVSK